MAKLVKVMVWAHEYMDGDKAAIKETVDYMAEQVLLEFPDFMSVATPQYISLLRTEWAVEITQRLRDDESTDFLIQTGGFFSREEAQAHADADLRLHGEKKPWRKPHVVHRMYTDWVPDE